jgi:hypothetical protein
LTPPTRRFTSERADMATNPRDESESGVSHAIESGTFNPRDTDHPTGSQQAAENAANDPPS